MGEGAQQLLTVDNINFDTITYFENEVPFYRFIQIMNSAAYKLWERGSNSIEK